MLKVQVQNKNTHNRQSVEGNAKVKAIKRTYSSPENLYKNISLRIKINPLSAYTLKGRYVKFKLS